MSAEMKCFLGMQPVFDHLGTGKPLEDCIAAANNADRANRDADQAIADADRAMQPYREVAARAKVVSRAIGRPDLEAEIRHAIHAHDDCHVGYLVRTK